jgi:predicted PurR-regulated permease PerM
MVSLSSSRRSDAPRAARRPRVVVSWSPRMVAAGAGVVALAAITVAGLYAVRYVLVLVYVCLILAVALHRPVRAIERFAAASFGRRPPRSVAVLGLYLSAAAVLGAMVMTVLPPLVVQARELGARAPQLVERAQSFLDANGLERVRLASLVPQWVRDGGADVVGTVFGTMTSILGGVLGLATIVVLTFYLLLDGEALVDRVSRLVPSRRRPQARAIGARIADKVSAWLAGQLVLCVVIGTATGIAIGLLGVPFPYVLAIVAAIGELIPYVGPFAAGVIACGLAAVSVSWQIALATAAYFLVQQVLENNVIQPKLMGRQVGLRPATVIIAVLLGGSLLGVTGVVLAVPTAAVVESALEELAPQKGPDA